MLYQVTLQAFAVASLESAVVEAVNPDHAGQKACFRIRRLHKEGALTFDIQEIIVNHIEAIDEPTSYNWSA